VEQQIREMTAAADTTATCLIMEVCCSCPDKQVCPK